LTDSTGRREEEEEEKENVGKLDGEKKEEEEEEQDGELVILIKLTDAGGVWLLGSPTYHFRSEKHT